MKKNEKTILFVDDEEDFLQYVADAMRNSGYGVLTKTNASEALSLLDEGAAVDLVITDYAMPGMNGLEFMAALRKRAKSAPIVLLTARGDVETYFRALNLGAYEVTSKPISMRTLHAIVKAALACPEADRRNTAAGGNETTSTPKKRER